MIKVKSHKRVRKNGVSVIKSHMKKGTRKKVMSSLKEYKDMGIQTALKKGVPKEYRKTALLRAALADTNKYEKTHDDGIPISDARKTLKAKLSKKKR